MITVVLDPGHGGAAKVGGSSANNATGPTGLLEKEVTLDLCRRVQRELAGSERHVVLTRDGDVNLGLKERAVMAREEKANAFVSIHFNGWKTPAVQGTETFVHSSGSEASLRLARLVQAGLLRATGLRDRGVKRAAYGVLNPSHHSPGTACCLAEVSFLTDPREEARLKTGAYLDILARAVAAAIKEYMGERMTV